MQTRQAMRMLGHRLGGLGLLLIMACEPNQSALTQVGPTLRDQSVDGALVVDGRVLIEETVLSAEVVVLLEMVDGEALVVREPLVEQRTEPYDTVSFRIDTAVPAFDVAQFEIVFDVVTEAAP